MNADLQAEWNAALDDAGISPAKARLYTFPPEADAGEGRQAVYQAPGEIIMSGPGKRFLEVLNEDLEVHRVGIAHDLEPHLAAAIIRHELEHARQFEQLGLGIFRVQDFLTRASWEKTGRAPVGGGVLINVSPPELDANAAAARFVWSRHAALVSQYMTAPDAAHQVLFRYERGPEPLSTLLWRTLAFVATLSDLCEEVALKYARQPLRLRDFLEEQFPGAGVIWDSLRPRS